MKITILLALIFAFPVVARSEINCQVENRVHSPPPRSPRRLHLQEADITFSFIVNKEGAVENIELVKVSGDRSWVNSYRDALSKTKYKKPRKPYSQTCMYEVRFSYEPLK